MPQASLLPVRVLNEVDSRSLGLDGKDLKRVAVCDDGNEYAMKRIEDHPLLPLSEWVCYSIFRACGVAVPDCAVLQRDDAPPAFGSRIVGHARQVKNNPDIYTATTFFTPHSVQIGRIYPLDALLPNPDRHGRNMLTRPGLTGNALLAFDFSQAWLMSGQPFGETSCLNGSLTQQWWSFFRSTLKIKPDAKVLDESVPAIESDWIVKLIDATPHEWRSSINSDEVGQFWQDNKAARLDFAKRWL